LIKNLVVEVNDGALDIGFLHQLENPEIRAIEIQQIADRPLTSGIDLIVEAEDFTTFNDVEPGVGSFVQNMRGDASGGDYMESIGDRGDSYLEYSVVLPVDGVYQIALRGTGERSNQNSFLVSVDGGPDSAMHLNENDRWGWATVNDTKRSGLGPYLLSSGPHTIRINQREANSKIDQLRISNVAGVYLPLPSLPETGAGPGAQNVGSVSNL